MNFNEICALFGGQTATARELGLKSARHVRRVCAGSPVPEKWIETLKQKAVVRAQQLTDFSEENNGITINKRKKQ